MMKKIGLFIACFMAIVGAGCSLGWLGYHNEWFAFAGCCVVIAFAIPQFIKFVKELVNG